MSTNASRKIATRWLSFYTYAFLPFKILTSFVPLLAEYDTLIEQGYKVELDPLIFVPIVVGDIFICFLIYGLHKKKLWGWICNWIFLGAMVLLNPIYLKMSFGAYLVGVILLSLTFFLPNYIYFKKRRFLFEGSKEPKNTPNSFSQKELEWIAAYMNRGFEKHKVTPHPEVMNFIKNPGPGTLDYALQAEPKTVAIVDKAKEILERTEKSSKTPDLETPAGQIESISPDAVRANGEGRGVSTESPAKPPETAPKASADIGGKEIYGSYKAEAAILIFVGILFLFVLVIFAVGSLHLNDNNSKQGGLMDWEQWEKLQRSQDAQINDNTANREYLFPEDRPASSPNIREPYYNSGVEYEKKVQDPNAVEDYYTARDPHSALLHTNRGNNFFERGKYARAIEAYRKALDINPSYVAAYYNRSVVYTRIGYYDHAITDCNKALELDPSHANSYYSRGVSYWNLGSKKQAIKDFQAAAKLKHKGAQDFLISKGIKW